MTDCNGCRHLVSNWHARPPIPGTTGTCPTCGVVRVVTKVRPNLVAVEVLKVRKVKK